MLVPASVVLSPDEVARLRVAEVVTCPRKGLPPIAVFAAPGFPPTFVIIQLCFVSEAASTSAMLSCPLLAVGFSEADQQLSAKRRRIGWRAQPPAV